MSEQTPILELYRGDILLAVLSNIQLYDWPWYRCNFQPTPAFEQYKPLFDRELELLEDKAWELAYEKIEELRLSLVDPSEGKTTDLFLLHIEGQTASFRAAFD